MSGIRSKASITGSLPLEAALVKNADGSAISSPVYADCVYDAASGQWVCDTPAPDGTYGPGSQLLRLKGSAPPVTASSMGTVVVSGSTTTPDKPYWTYTSGLRLLALAHSTLPASELEYSHDGGLTYVAYTATLSIDANAHPAGDYLARVKAATGRNPSATQPSPAIAAKPAGNQVPLYLGVGNSHMLGLKGSGDSTIGSAGHEAWADQALAKFNVNGVVCAFKVFGYSGATSDEITAYINGEIKDWVVANSSKYSEIIPIGQELYNQANLPGATAASTYNSFMTMLTALKALPGVNKVLAFTGYPGDYQAREIIIAGANKLLIEHRNEFAWLAQVFNTRTVPEAGSFSGGTVDDSKFHLNEKGNGQIAAFFVYGIGTGANLVIDPAYVPPVVYNFKDNSFEGTFGTDPRKGWVKPPNGDFQLLGNGEMTITDAIGATDGNYVSIAYQDVPVEQSKQYQVGLDADVTKGTIRIHGGTSGTPNHVQLLPGGGVVPFIAQGATERLIIEAAPGTTARLRFINIDLFVAAGGSKGDFNNSNWANPEDGTERNWRHYAGWTVNGNGRAVLDTSAITDPNAQVYLFQLVDNLDTTKQYRIRFQGKMNADSKVRLRLNVYSPYGAPTDNAPYDQVFTPESSSMLLIIEGYGTGFLTNAILALDDANFPA